MQFGRLLVVILSVTAILLAAHVLASDKIYRWVDENGVVHFGDRPDTQKTAEKIELPQHEPSQAYQPGNQPPAEPEPLITEPSYAEKKRLERAARRKESNQQRQEIAGLCAEAQQKIARYEPRPRVMVKNEDGTVSRIDDNQRQQILAAAKSFIDDNCH